MSIGFYKANHGNTILLPFSPTLSEKSEDNSSNTVSVSDSCILSREYTEYNLCGVFRASTMKYGLERNPTQTPPQ
jgi:hypothetical protein